MGKYNVVWEGKFVGYDFSVYRAERVLAELGKGQRLSKFIVGNTIYAKPKVDKVG